MHPLYVCRPTFQTVTNFPDTLLMNAFNGVNLASACIITSVEYATKLGVPQDKWVYITGGAGSNDSSNCEIRPFHHFYPDTNAVQFGNDPITTPARRSSTPLTMRWSQLESRKTKSTASTFIRKHKLLNN
jgi:hypothetical protein